MFVDDLEVVKSIHGKASRLGIGIDADGRIDEIKPKIDPDYDNFFKRPETFYPILQIDEELYCDEQIHSCDCKDD